MELQSSTGVHVWQPTASPDLSCNLFGSPSLASEAAGQQPPHSLHHWFLLSAGSKNWGIPNVETH